MGDGLVVLREVNESDYALFFAHRSDPVASQMAAFGTPVRDAEALAARWKAGASGGTTTSRTIVVEGEAVGYAAVFLHDGKPQVTYWIARSHWGRGIATEALGKLLAIVTARPLYASTAGDNAGSRRVLEKCGFVVTGREKAFAEGRGGEVEEVFFELGE